VTPSRSRATRACCGQGRRHVLEARGALVDAVVAGEGGGPTGALAHQQHPHAGRAAPLVRGRGRGVPAAGQRPSPGGGAGVDEERDPPVEARRDLRDGLDGADLVVGGLEGHHPGAGRDQVDDVVGGDPPVPVDRHHGARHAAAPGPPVGGVAHGAVLDGAEQRGVAAVGTALEEPEQAPVHGLGARGGEGDLVAAHPQRPGHHLAGVVEQQPGVAAGPVQAPRVAPATLVRRGQDLARRGVQRLARGRVEVDRRGIRHNRHGRPPCAAGRLVGGVL
jgi:hypothetical protein